MKKAIMATISLTSPNLNLSRWIHHSGWLAYCTLYTIAIVGHRLGAVRLALAALVNSLMVKIALTVSKW